MPRLGGTLALLALGCSFESTSGSTPMLHGDDDPTTGVVESSSGSEASSTPPEEASTAVPESETTSTPTTAPAGETEEPGTTTRAMETGEPDTAGPAVDCADPRVLSVVAEDAELTPPMQLGQFMSVPFAFSDVANSGDAVFTFEVECPSMYRLFARVRDDSPGTSGCCDPDSFVVRGPEGLDVQWFYGCDTGVAGWNWARVASGQAGQSCAQAQPVLVPLVPGTHQFTLHNRESNYFEAVAGVAELVLTNDPDFVP